MPRVEIVYAGRFPRLGEESGYELSAVGDFDGAANGGLEFVIGIDAESRVESVHQVFGLDGKVGDFGGGGVSCAEQASAGDAAAGEYDGPGFAVMVATGAVIDLRSAAEFA